MMRIVLEGRDARTTTLQRKRTQPVRLIQWNRFDWAIPGTLPG